MKLVCRELAKLPRTMHYLPPTTEGATYVWPRSHELLSALAALAPTEHARFGLEKRSIYKSVGRQLGNAGVKDLSPVELKVGAGDVLFHDMLTRIPAAIT